MKAAEEKKKQELLRTIKIHGGDPEDDYETLETVGKGNYGIVIKAKNKTTGQMVAIKKTLLTDTIELECAVKEIRVMERCHHPNVVEYIATYHTPAALCIVMEFCDAGSIEMVRKLLKFNLPEPLIAYVMHEALKGLQYMHEQHFIHRDIKGDNLLINTKGEIKLADFGVSAELHHTLSRRNSHWGTLLYMAPEVLLETDYDERADIWSLGISMLELAEGVLPFSRMMRYPLVDLLTKKNPPTLQHQDKFSPQMNAFLRRLLTKDKYARPTAASMLEDSFLHRDYEPLREEMANIARRLVERRQEIFASRSIESWSSSEEEEATFVQRRSGHPGDGEEAKEKGQAVWDQQQEAYLRENTIPIPLLSTEDFSFDALQYADEDTEPMQVTEVCTLLSGAALTGLDIPPPPRGVNGPSLPSQRLLSLQNMEASAPQMVLHQTKMLQYLYLYYTQLSSMRCLTKKEAASMVETQSKLEDTLGLIYRVRLKRR